MRQPIRAVAVVINDGSILLMHRVDKGKEYYVFPGGGVEDNEKIEEAVVREVQEEMSIKVKIIRLLYHHHLLDNENESEQYFYLCKYLNGEPKLAEGTNEIKRHISGTTFYEPMWYPVNKLSQTLLYPLEIRDWLIEDLKVGFGSKTKEATFKISELRQSL